MYYFSEGTGLVKVQDTPGAKGYKTEHEAIIAFYVNEKRKLLSKIDKYKIDTKILEQKVQELDRKYSCLTEKYPEEFI